MNQIETTLIESIHVDFPEFERRFCLKRISYRDYDVKDDRNARLATMARDIYAGGPVLALHHYHKERSYYVLLQRDAELKLDDSRLTTTTVDICQAYNWLMAMLLIKALPSQLLGMTLEQDASRFEAEGLYYLVRYEPLPNRAAPQVIAVEVGIAPQPLARSGQMLRIFVRTFTPVVAFFNERGELPPKFHRRERFRLDQRSQCLQKSVEGEYFKKGLRRNDRKRVAMLDLQKQSMSDFQCSKLGVLNQFIKDLHLAYGVALDLRLQRIDVTERRWQGTSQVNSQYEKIRQVVKEYPIALIDLAGNIQATLRLHTTLVKMGFAVHAAGAPERSSCNLLIVPNKDNFEGERKLDPYRKIKRAYAEMVIQACYPENLLGDGELPDHMLDVLLKELLLKLEYKEKRQIFGDYPIPAGAIFILPLRKDSDDDDAADDRESARREWRFLAMEQVAGKLHFSELDMKYIESMLDSIDDEFVASRLVSKYWRHANLPIVYWPCSGDILAFVDTEAVVLPDHQGIEKALNQLSIGRIKNLPAGLLREFCDTFSGNTVAGKLQAMFLAAPKSEYRYDDLRSFKISNRGGHNQFFYAWLADQIGAPLKLSFQAKGGVLDATTGFGLDIESKLYFAGSVGGAKLKVENFSHLYHLHSTLPVIPTEILQLMQPMHIKNKGFTVYPLPFKYLREFGEELNLQQD